MNLLLTILHWLNSGDIGESDSNVGFRYGGWDEGANPGDDSPNPEGLWEVLLRILQKCGIPLCTFVFLVVAGFSVRSGSKSAFLRKLKEPTSSLLVTQSERLNQTELGKELGQFFEEIKQKRIARTGIADESDCWNDFWEIMYYYTNLPKSPRYGSFYAVEGRLAFPFEKDKFFENNDIETYRSWKNRVRNGSAFDPRTVWPSKDSFSQGILPLTTKCPRPLEIPPYPENWPKKRRYPVRIRQNDQWFDFSTF